MMLQLLDEIFHAQKQGEVRGIPSICSAHPWVLKAVMQQAVDTNASILVESTCNQVNQFGGYTAMTPADFVHFIQRIAIENNLPLERLMLGGDHLGPHVWQAESAESAMQKAVGMVRAYIRAGYTKIHLDASMKLGDDDPSHPLDVELSTARAATLARAAEETLAKLYPERWDGSEPSQGIRYVIGTEVPAAGGVKGHEESVAVTTVESARQTIEATHKAFLHAGLESAWERVVAVVVQPGVEFGDDYVLDYNPDDAYELSRFSETTPLIYEAHSTDYQKREALRDLVHDHFAILKVGPALTFAYREAVFALAMIEGELYPPGECSNLIEVLDSMMVSHPDHWQKYYAGTPREQAYKRKYSLSDRARYYWSQPQLQAALAKLLANLGRIQIPLTLVSQFAPLQWEKVRGGEIKNTPEELIPNRIQSVLDDYFFACGICI